MLKCSHFEEYVGYNIIKNYIKEHISKEIRPTFFPIYPLMEALMEIEIESLVLLAVMAICMEHFKV